MAVITKKTLLISQCVDKEVYNVNLAAELESKGVVLVPGKATAPGSVFSDKDSTYRLLSENGSDWQEVARYRKVDVDGKTTAQVVDNIFEFLDELKRETGERTFFVKPREGGGGLGGFRITITDNGYIIPDLSKVTGCAKEIHPTFIDFDTSGQRQIAGIIMDIPFIRKRSGYEKKLYKG